ncbi:MULTISPECIES: hypothetical protein [Bacillaceae]|uniref:Flp pilus assembly protein TadB n=2 Tax=Bacillaceae TaxID=186817 RepID=A0A7V7RHZ9_9BACI|nr:MULTISPECIES: hypothetical protein [Bacillaceae]KAB2329452.1 hypothetical protein F7732_21240 [Bacillus mesophilum]QVY63937.1 hypothetical protein J1899_22450 [Cytobacillus gottheilii]
MNIASAGTWVSIVVYLVGFFSVVGISLSLGLNVQKYKERLKIDRQLKLQNYNKVWIQQGWLKQYHLLLSSAIPKYRLDHFSKIVIIQFVLFISLFAALYIGLQAFVFVLAVSFTIVYILPISFLYIRHKQKQNTLKEEMVTAAIILLQEYQKNHYHMLYALKALVDQTSGQNQIAYARLFARMHDNNFMKELAAEEFAFQLGHIRGKNLSTIILKACKDGRNVITLLEDLIEDVTEFNKRIRNAETEAREPALIGYAPLPLLAIFYYMNETMLIHGGNTFQYQFQTEQGLRAFLIAIVFGLMGTGLALVVKKPRK